MYKRMRKANAIAITIVYNTRIECMYSYIYRGEGGIIILKNIFMYIMYRVFFYCLIIIRKKEK